MQEQCHVCQPFNPKLCDKRWSFLWEILVAFLRLCLPVCYWKSALKNHLWSFSHLSGMTASTLKHPRNVQVHCNNLTRIHLLPSCKSLLNTLPIYLKRVLLIPASRERVIKSPRLAAMGVAMLSGLIPTFLAPMITPIITRPREDTEQASEEASCCVSPWSCYSGSQRDTGSGESKQHIAHSGITQLNTGHPQEFVLLLSPIWRACLCPCELHQRPRGTQADSRDQRRYQQAAQM